MEIVKPRILINNELYYTMEDVVKLVSASARTISRIIKRNGIQYLYLNRHYYFKPSWVDELIDKLTVCPKKRFNISEDKI